MLDDGNGLCRFPYFTAVNGRCEEHVVLVLKTMGKAGQQLASHTFRISSVGLAFLFFIFIFIYLLVTHMALL